MTDLCLVMFSGGLWLRVGPQHESLTGLECLGSRQHLEELLHMGSQLKAVCAHLAQSQSSHGLVLQHRYFKLFMCIMYMQLLCTTHIYIHITHTVLQCMCAVWAMHRAATNSELAVLWSAQCV